MTIDQINDMLRNLNERISVLEAENTTEKYILPHYTERDVLLDKLAQLQGV